MYEAPYPPYDFTDKASFAYETVLKRWPIIITGVIDNIYRSNHDLGVSLSSNGVSEAAIEIAHEKITEGKDIIEKIGKLKYDMARDRPLEPIIDDGEAMVETYNTEIARLEQAGKGSWFTAPWLFAEYDLRLDTSAKWYSILRQMLPVRIAFAHLSARPETKGLSSSRYRLIRSFFVVTKHWHQHDPFFLQKQETFQRSSVAIYKLATTMQELQRDKAELDADPANLSVIFKEMIQMCLWGNATDLSMLTNLSHDDIQHLQSVGREAQAARKEFILRDDQDKVWTHLTTLKNAQVDFVLDNAGFELFTDFVFADFLVTHTPYVSKVVFHPKLIPWFVSDVTPPDFASSIQSLLSPTFFPTASDSEGATPEVRVHLKEMVERWQSYISSGVFALSVPQDVPLGYSDAKADFWTSPFPYWNMKEQAPEVFGSLADSGLVIFKGDLNFRKLTGDVQWPASTPFETALGPLAGSFPILSLRTNKADVVVGVDPEVADRLDKSGEKWRFNGKYALVSFLPKA